jgi:hypothetical protein
LNNLVSLKHLAWTNGVGPKRRGGRHIIPNNHHNKTLRKDHKTFLTGTVKFKLPEFFLNKTIEFKVHVYETTVHANSAYDMIIGRDLITELKLVLGFDAQCITWDCIDQPMKTQGGLQKETTHYEDLYSALVTPSSTIFQDDYDVNREPQHVHAANKRQTRMLYANYKAADLKDIIKCFSTIDDIEKKTIF